MFNVSAVFRVVNDGLDQLMPLFYLYQPRLTFLSVIEIKVTSREFRDQSLALIFLYSVVTLRNLSQA